jgi:hypothetical protein
MSVQLGTQQPHSPNGDLCTVCTGPLHHTNLAYPYKSIFLCSGSLLVFQANQSAESLRQAFSNQRCRGWVNLALLTRAARLWFN